MHLGGTAALGDHSVHRIGFGAMQLAGPGVFGPPCDRAEALRVLRRAVELGVDHIDTSQYYGPVVVNELIREALHPYDGVCLVSKVGARRDDKGGWHPWNRPEDLRQGIEDNLRTLAVDQLGVVNLRVMDGRGLGGLEEQLAAMAQAREDGLIAGVGVSNVTLEQLLFCAERVELACVQNPFSYVDRSSQAVLDECRRRNVAFVPFFPLGSGFGVADVRGHPSVVAAAARLGATPAQVALAWTMAQGTNVLLIPGTSSVTHLEENLAAADLRPEDLRLDE
ncbi:MAG: Oxidoreductase [Frankiales bacterium]|nr:Oxidoreductase [Frankiales bacterium]